MHRLGLSLALLTLLAGECAAQFTTTVGPVPVPEIDLGTARSALIVILGGALIVKSRSRRPAAATESS